MTDSPAPKPRKKRKPSEIPPSELRKRLVNQGKHATVIDFIIETRIAKAREKQQPVREWKSALEWRLGKDD